MEANILKEDELIGELVPEITGDQLPSKKQVLQILLYRTAGKQKLRDCAREVLEKVQVFWDKARLRTQRSYKCINKIENLYEFWKKISRNMGRDSNQQKEQDFKRDIENLFDIAHGDVLKNISESQTNFLLHQRKAGREGFISDLTAELERDAQIRIQKKRKADERAQIYQRRLEKSEAEKQNLSK